MARTVGRVTPSHARGALLAGVVASALLAGCSGAGPVSSSGEAPGASPADVPSAAAGQPRSSPPDDDRPSPAAAEKHATLERSRPAPEPRRSYLRVPAIGLRSVPVLRYAGSPDDAKGTRIQNRGPASSPRGPAGGVGPGEVGNFIVTGHRTSHLAPFRDLPALRPGDRVRVRVARTVYVYRITATRSTSFRSQRSLAEQSAPVPGRPNADPVRPMITLSTCATPEDHAAGNYWSDRFGNPEHRIDKVGVLVAERRTGR